MKGAIIASILLLVSVRIAGQTGALTRESDQWRFARYPAAAHFKGKPARPLLATDLEHTHRTRIRTEARKGPNFAGRFTLVKWGCGSPCLQFVIIDARSGTVYDPGFIVGCSDKNGLEAIIDFKPASRLVIATGHSQELGCGSAFYEWDEKQLRPVHFQPWPKPSD